MSGNAPVSLTRRLILTLTVGAVLLWLLGALVSGLLLQHELSEAFDGGLRETGERLLPLARDTLEDRDEDDDRPHIAEEDDDLGAEYVVYQLRDRAGRLLLRSRDAPERPFAVPLEDETFASDARYRVYTLAGGSGLYLHIAEEESHRLATLLGAMGALLLPLVPLVPLAGFGILLAVRRGLAPVATLSTEVAARHAARLEPLPTSDLPDELRPMAEAVNDLLLRLREALAAERAFAANSAHELRTPIAGSLAQVQRLIAELEDGPPRQRARRVAEALGRLGALAEKLLQLSRAEAGMAPAAPIDLLPALRLVTDDRMPLRLAADATLVAPLDVDAFGIVMRNLIENAATHGRGNVTVALIADNILEVTNDAPPVPPETLATLGRRFARGTATTPGTGLGLAIVVAILGQVGGRLELLSPIPGRRDGFCARVVLPTG